MDSQESTRPHLEAAGANDNASIRLKGLPSSSKLEHRLQKSNNEGDSNPSGQPPTNNSSSSISLSRQVVNHQEPSPFALNQQYLPSSSDFHGCQNPNPIQSNPHSLGEFSASGTRAGTVGNLTGNGDNGGDNAMFHSPAQPYGASQAPHESQLNQVNPQFPQNPFNDQGFQNNINFPNSPSGFGTELISHTGNLSNGFNGGSPLFPMWPSGFASRPPGDAGISSYVFNARSASFSTQMTGDTGISTNGVSLMFPVGSENPEGAAHDAVGSSGLHTAGIDPAEEPENKLEALQPPLTNHNNELHQIMPCGLNPNPTQILPSSFLPSDSQLNSVPAETNTSTSYGSQQPHDQVMTENQNQHDQMTTEDENEFDISQFLNDNIFEETDEYGSSERVLAEMDESNHIISTGDSKLGFAGNETVKDAEDEWLDELLELNRTNNDPFDFLSSDFP